MTNLHPDCPICRAPGPLAAPRHVAAWGDMTAAEQFTLLARLGEALAAGAAGFTVAADHGHFHLREGGAQALRLTTGAADPLLPLIAQGIDAADSVDLAVAFAMDSGVQLIAPWFRDLLNRGGRLRVVVGDYMDVTEPAALHRLADLQTAEVRVFETGTGSFHPKAWLFRAADRRGAAIVGSSNLSRTALTSGVEWNLHAEGAADVVTRAFNDLWTHPKTRPLTADWIAAYTARRQGAPLTDLAHKIVADEGPAPPPEPHAIQRAALRALTTTRIAGYQAGLVVLATGLGKTWLAAFDSRPFARVGATTRMGERSLRRLLIIGANSVIIKRHVHATAKPGTWLGGMLTRKPPMLVRVALANKMARIVWALMARGGVYKAPAMAV